MSETQDDIRETARKAAVKLGHFSDSLEVEIVAEAILSELVAERIRMGMHINRMVKDAVDAERDRCATVAAKWKGHPVDFHLAGKMIATLIREGV